jgi:hypothetical protein
MTIVTTKSLDQESSCDAETAMFESLKGWTCILLSYSMLSMGDQKKALAPIPDSQLSR